VEQLGATLIRGNVLIRTNAVPSLQARPIIEVVKIYMSTHTFYMFCTVHFCTKELCTTVGSTKFAIQAAS